MVLLGGWLDSTLEIFSNPRLYDSMILLNIQWASNLETVHFLFKLNFWYSDVIPHDNIEKFNKVQN